MVFIIEPTEERKMELKMPSFGMTMKEGLVANWLKEEGDEIKEGEAILEIETEKLTKELESPVNGILKEIIVEEGDEAECGETIAIIEETT